MWVPGHVGISGNESVDILPKQGALKEGIDFDSYIYIWEYPKIHQFKNIWKSEKPLAAD